MKTLKNKVFITGRLGYDPESIKFDSGRVLARIRLAVNEYKKQDGAWMPEETHWHNVQAWGKLAEKMISTLSKGDEVVIEGKLINNSYTDKDGNNRYTTSIEAEDFLIKSKPNGKRKEE